VGREFERWQWLELVASEHGPADPSTRHLLHVMGLHMNQQGHRCFPSQELLAKRTGLSVRSVRTHIGHAVDSGWVRIVQKPRPGKQAWFVHQYIPMIPAQLADLCKSKPWEDDPTWKREEESAGRGDNESSNAAVTSNHYQVEIPRESSRVVERPAIGAERAAILAEHPANFSATPGKFCRNARQGLPTNSSSNSSSNSPMNSPHEGAPLSRRTAVSEIQLKERDSKAARLEKAVTLLRVTPDMPADNVAAMFTLSAEEVQQVRRQACA
jgi:hypothetical protein